MLKQYLILVSLLFLSIAIFAQKDLNLKNIEIVRDAYGVPHIFTKTDAEAVYGVAWAQCEDNFHLMQDNFASTKGLAGRLIGKTGAVLDLLYEVFKMDEFVNRRYAQDISPEMEKLLNNYTAAINKYAETHPKEVKHKKIFPITAKEVLGNHVLHFILLHSSAMELGKFLTKEFSYALIDNERHGSNAMAYSPNITADGKSYLVGNPHQPINEMGNFWEVSVHSEEGYEAHGATFSIGGLFPVIAANRNLGWSHTTNYQNSADIYKLEMHPSKKNHYKYDGEWIPLEVNTAKLKVKIGFMVIPVAKKYYWSKYGPTFKKKNGYFSFKSHAFHNIKAPEQWYKMGLAKNLEEFEAALDIQGLAAQTITYADKEGNIFHLSNFAHPYRNEEYDWSELKKGNTVILPGNTSKSNWTLDKIHPISDLAQVKNPKCGYVYNCNNTVFRMTAPEENLKPEDFPAHFGMLESSMVRSNTFEKLISTHDKVTFEDVRKMRESVTIDKNKMSFRYCTNCSDIPLFLNKYPELAPAKEVFDKWNGSFAIDNKQAPLMAIAGMHIEEYVKSQFGNEEKEIPEKVMVKTVLKAQKFLLKHYGTLELELGTVQKAVRYGVELPMYGGINTLANTHIKPYKKGKVELAGGDSFIIYAKFGENGLEELNTVNAFGNSLKEGNPYSTNQTEMYVNQKTRKAELDLKKLKASGKIYNPK